jgi:hypothetical protein
MNFRQASSTSNKFFKGWGNLFRCPKEQNRGLEPAPETHRNEFPVGYSLASCSSAELASAWPTALILKPTAPVTLSFFSERQPVPHFRVSPEGFTPGTVTEAFSVAVPGHRRKLPAASQLMCRLHEHSRPTRLRSRF